MSNLVGGMPGSMAARGRVVEWGKFPWMEILELAQSHPGIPTCHESLQNVKRHSYITEAVRHSDLAAHGKDHKKGMAPDEIREVIAAGGGHFTPFSRTVTKDKDINKATGNVWIRWDPDRAEA